MKLNFETSIAEGTPEELVEYLRLVEEGEKKSGNELFSFGHAHQPDEDTLKSIVGSLVKVDKEYTDSTETSTDEADLGEFYTVNVDNSALSKGTILKKVDKHTLKDSLGDEYLHVDANAVEHIDKQLYDLEDRFSFATQIGIRLQVGARLSDNTDLAQATEGDYFKVTDSYEYLMVGDIVTIAEDDRDNQPLCKDEHGNSCYVHLGHLELIQEPTEISTDEAETASTGLQVGDKVRVLKSACGAVGEATVTAVHENGEVEIAGTSREGIYLSNWSSHVTLLEKIEEEDVEVDPEEAEEEEAPMGYTFWYLDTANFNPFVVLKASLEGYFEDSTGKRYTYQAVSGLIKPIDNEYARKAFERARHNGKLLKYYPTVDAFQTSY